MQPTDNPYYFDGSRGSLVASTGWWTPESTSRRLVLIEGPEAEDFLNRLSTVNTKHLLPGFGHRGCFLNALGKIRATFTLWRYGNEAFVFESELEWENRILEFIDQFHFGEALQFTRLGESLAGALLFSQEEFPDLATPLLNLETIILPAAGVRVHAHGTSEFGVPCYSVWAKQAELNAWLDSVLPHRNLLTPETLEDWRILSLCPKAGKELLYESIIPLECGLSDAVSPNKGCYPGQEVVERIFTYGSPPRRLALIEMAGLQNNASLELPAPLYNQAEPPQEVGSLTSLSYPGEKRKGLAIVKKLIANPGTDVFLSTGQKVQITQVAPYEQTPS